MALIGLLLQKYVTHEEHLRLTRFDKTHNGWDRYRNAKVSVKNTEPGEQDPS
jgi:hypothetical protein